MSFEHVLLTGDFVSVKKLYLSLSIAEWLAAEGYSKLLPKISGPYRALSVDPEYVKVLQKGVDNIISINRIDRAPNSTDDDSDKSDTKQTMADNNFPDELTTKNRKSKEHTVDTIVDYKKHNYGIRYLTRCYGYNACRDTYELAAQIPNHIAERYWKPRTNRIDNKRLTWEKWQDETKNNDGNKPEKVEATVILLH